MQFCQTYSQFGSLLCILTSQRVLHLLIAGGNNRFCYFLFDFTSFLDKINNISLASCVYVYTCWAAIPYVSLARGFFTHKILLRHPLTTKSTSKYSYAMKPVSSANKHIRPIHRAHTGNNYCCCSLLRKHLHMFLVTSNAAFLFSAQPIQRSFFEVSQK